MQDKGQDDFGAHQLVGIDDQEIIGFVFESFILRKSCIQTVRNSEIRLLLFREFRFAF